MHSRRAHLTIHTGERASAPPTAEQLRLGEHNHIAVQARMRAVDQAVRTGTYRGRDGTAHPFTARHQLVMLRLCLVADVYGEVHPHVLTLASLAADVGRTLTNVAADVRQLEAALLLWRRPVVDEVGRRFVYVIPGMAAPLDEHGRPQRARGG